MTLVEHETWRLRRLALVISGIYTVMGAMWLQSHTVGPELAGLPLWMQLRTVLDVTFTITTGSALYLVLYRVMRRIHHSERALSAERALRRSDEKLRGIVAGSPLAIATLDPGGRVLSWNRAATDLYGWEPTEVYGLAEPQVPSEHREAAGQLWSRVLRGECFTDVEVRRVNKHGQPIDVSLSAAPLYDEQGAVASIVTFSADITERKKQAQRVEHLATHDPLTNLPNRRILDEHLARVIDRSQRGAPAALLMIDLDNFKLINDSLGHLHGDQFLVAMTGVLNQTLRGGDLLARFGGDEFALLLEDVSPQQAKLIADRMVKAVFAYRYQNQGRAFETSASIGIAPITGQSSAQDVQVAADRALLIAKEEGRNRVVVYSGGDETAARLGEASRWASKIQDALRQDRFVLLFQPVVRLESGRAEHFEVLLRMTGDDGKLIAPGAFMHAAERFGLMPQIDRWVVEHVLNVLVARPDLHAFVNLSGGSIADEELLAFIERRLGACGLGKDRLVFEITETVAVRDLDRAQHWMRRLIELGCRFALDDFGIAFSSFSYLRALPVSYVKIDGSFIKNLPDDACNRAMVQALVTVAHALDKQVIAEWVETQSAADILKQIGAEYGQGYRWGMPGPEAASVAAAAVA